MSALAVAAALSAGCAVGMGAWLLGDPPFRAWLAAQASRLRARRRARLEGAPFAPAALPALRMRATALRDGVARARRDRARADERARLLDELPELIDVVALGLSAGISFDAALEIYCARYDTALAARMGDAMRSWRLGMAARREALRGLAAQLQVGAFTTFVETVTESLDFGAPLVKTLVGQADAVRRERRMVLEERIEKAPVKMLVPTGALVLPAMLLAILGPILASLARLTG